jgi:hypothetical protein
MRMMPRIDPRVVTLTGQVTSSFVARLWRVTTWRIRQAGNLRGELLLVQNLPPNSLY